MVEKGLLIALVALAVVSAASAISTQVNKLVERVECAFEQAQVCIIDGEAE